MGSANVCPFSLGPMLESGEQPPTNLVAGVTVSRMPLGLDALFGPTLAAAADRFYLLATSDRRLYCVALERGRPKDIEWIEPLGAVTVVRCRKGVLWSFLDLEREPANRIVRFRVSRAGYTRMRRIADTIQSPLSTDRS
jgi:hypothetical protein